MTTTTLDPKLSIALSQAIDKGLDSHARDELAPGVYRDLQISVKITVDEMRVAADTDRAATCSIPLLPTCALLLQRLGAQRENTLDLLREVMQEALTLGKDATTQLLQETGVAEMEKRLRKEVISTLPRVPVRGAVTIKPEAVHLTILAASAGEQGDD